MKAHVLVVAFLIITSISAHGIQRGAEPSLTVERKDSSNTYIIKYFDTHPANVVLTMKDSQGNMLLRRTVSHQTSFVIPVNLSSLSHGTYIVKADNGTKSVSLIIHYDNNTEPTYTRVVGLAGNMYLLTSSHVGQQTLTVKVYDENTNLIFDEQRSINGQVSILFNLSAVAGRPSFEVTETSGNSLMLPGNPIVVSILKPIEKPLKNNLN